MNAAYRVSRAGPLLVVILLLVIVVPNLFAPVVNDVLLALPGADKVAHFLVYGSAFLLLYALAGRTRLQRGPRTWVAAAAALLLAVADETIQGLVGGRTVDAADLGAGLAGIAAGIVASGARRRSHRRTGAYLALPILVATVLTADTYFAERDYKHGLRLERQGDFLGARASYLQALERGNRRPGLYNSLAWVELESGVGDPGLALEWAGIALAARPDDPDFLDTYGWALVLSGRAEEGLEYLQQARRLKPSIWCIHFHLAIAHLEMGKTDEAIPHLRRQIERAPDSREGILARGFLEDLDVSESAVPGGTGSLEGGG